MCRSSAAAFSQDGIVKVFLTDDEIPQSLYYIKTMWLTLIPLVLILICSSQCLVLNLCNEKGRLHACLLLDSYRAYSNST